MHLLQYLSTSADQAHVVPRLHDEVAGAALERPHGQLDVRVRGQRHHCRRMRECADLIQQAQALTAVGSAGTEVQIEQQQGRMQSLQCSHDLRWTAQARHRCNPALQQQLRRQADVGIVVEQQDRSRVSAGV